MSVQRNLEIDTLRGFACILLVIYHVIGSDSMSGLKISDGLLREINDSLAYLRMPLFTFLSGVVYAYRPFQANVIKFLKGKGRRLLLPMLTVGTVFAILRHGINGMALDDIYWKTIHIYPVAHFWFVEAIFLIFVLMVILEKLINLDKLTNSIIILLISILLHLIGTEIKVLAFDGFLYLLPFFIFGNILQRFNMRKKISPLAAMLLILLGVFLIILISIGTLNAAPRFTAYGLISGLLLCAGLVSSNIKIVALARVGVYSYSIYIFHVFFTAASRMGLNISNVENVYLLIVIGSIIGIFGPIFIENILSRYPKVKFLLLGSKIKYNR